MGGSNDSSLPQRKVQRLPLSPEDQAPVNRKRRSYSGLVGGARQGRESTILSDILNGSQGLLGA